MKHLIFLLAVLIIMSSLMYGQSITHPWWVVDRGGGKSYRTEDTLRNTYGYWLKFSGEQTSPIVGSSYSLDTIDVRAGWNMIGTLSYATLTSDVIPIPPVIIKSNFFGYDAGYYTEDTLKPGLGYWVKTSEAGKIVLKIGTSLMNKSTPVLGKNNRNLSGFKISNIAQDKELNKLLITDAEGKSIQLYFTAKPIELDLEKYELPPSPPSGIFDVRFKSNRTIEIAKQKIRDEKQTFPIVINGGKEPFTVSWELANDKYSYSLEVVHENKMSKRYDLNTNGKFTVNISDLVSMKLVMDVNNTIDLPKEFSLHQNYPNPFNSTTEIRYQIPETRWVTLKVYDMLGREVTTLVDEMQEAGYKSVEWNANNYSSGIYYIKMISGTFADVKKMLLIK
jgi:hypothetical protein